MLQKRNPYKPKFATREGAPLPEHLRFRNQGRAAIAASGEMNASNKKDLMGQIGNLINSYMTGSIQRSYATDREAAKERKEILIQAIADESGETWKALGQVMAEDIFETTGREGFMRKLMAFKELEQGEIARARFRTRDVYAFTAASASEVTPIYVRNDWEILPEFYVSGEILIEERDIHQSTGDMLEERYQEGLEAIMTAEDKLWKAMADVASALANTITYFTTFTPGHFTQIKSQVTGWGIPAANCLIAYDLWDDMIGTAGFSEWFDPVNCADDYMVAVAA